MARQLHRVVRFLATSFVLLVNVCLSVSCTAGDARILFTAANPNPAASPTLGMWEEYSERNERFDRFVSAEFPDVPGFTCDLWCYESEDVEFKQGQPLENGGVKMRHAWTDRGWDVVTVVTPLTTGLDVVAQLESSERDKGPTPTEYPSLNICWQLRRATGFASKPDPYPAFVDRCFIFTQQGRTFLNDTKRLPIPVRSSGDKKNNPPWVQMYLPRSAPDDVRSNPDDWAAYSADRYSLPVIGVVSRDQRYLAAIATGSENMVCQAWHDCLHNNARWLSANGEEEKSWHVRIYVMENDPDALIARFKQDFPQVHPWKQASHAP